ncbi:MAG: hypothetical protein CMP22_00245 [Rickettsiales bacterium]|nr:hypothetical protein [Rickettsiales bacterium]
MKKFLIVASGALVLLTIVAVAIGSIYLKPFIKTTLQEQLALHGYENATIGDVSVGLYESTVSDVNLNNKEGTRVGSIAISYWPQQLMNKRVNSIIIKDAKVDALMRLNGDVVVAGYTLEGILKSKAQKDSFYNQVNAERIHKKAGLSLVSKAYAADTNNQGAQEMPFNNIVVEGLNFSVAVPSGEVIKGLLSAEYDMSTSSAEGNVKLNQTKASALFEAANIVKPDLSQMVRNVQGQVTADMDFDIDNIKQLDVIKGTGTVTLNDVGADKDDMKIRGLNGKIDVANILPFSTDGKQKLTAKSASKSSIQITDLEATAGIKENTKLDLENAKINVAGGQIISSPFKADLTNINTDLTLDIQSVQFQKLAALLELTGINFSGIVNAKLPLSIRNNQVVLNQASVNNIIQSVAGDRLKQEADKLIQRKMGDKLDKFIGTEGTKSGTDQQNGQKPNVKDVINGIMGGF